MAEVKWIKIATDVFDDQKIRMIETMPEGDAVIVIWFKLLMLAGKVNDGGFIYFTKDIPYTDQMLATYFNKPLAIVQLAINTFLKFQMIEIVDDVIFVSNWEKHQNIEGLDRIREQTRKRVANHRERKKNECNVTVTLPVTQCNAIDKDIDKDIDKRKEVSKDTSKRKNFIPPTVDEVTAYCQERENYVDPEKFIDFYASKGWMVGSNKMKDWKAAVRTWEKKDKERGFVPKKNVNSGVDTSKIWTDEQYKAPFFGFPKEWFEGERLIEERVKSVIRPVRVDLGWYDEIEISAEELIADYRARKRYSNGEIERKSDI